MVHDHAHHMEPKTINYGPRFFIGIALNLSFVIIEFIYGITANSMALVADALHNAGDVLGLFIAWGGIMLAQAKSPDKFTFGFKNSTILTAFINAVILLIAVGAIGVEAIQKLYTPQFVASKVVIIVAGIGVCINGLTAVLFFSGRNEDINIQGAFLHMLADAALSLGVVIASLIILWTNQYWIDPLFSLFIAFFILISCWGNLKESVNLMMHATPKHINFNELKTLLASHEDVVSIHDLHVWAISTTETALAVHVVLKENIYPHVWIQTMNQRLLTKYRISHTTIQIDNISSEAACRPCELC